MRKLIFTATMAAIVSCNSGSSSSTEATMDDSSTTASSEVQQDVTYAYPVGYSSKFTTGDPKNSQAVLNIWKAFDNGDLASAKDYLSSSIDAVIALKSIDKDENWALVWGKERDTHKDGKVDSVYLQETWRFNKDGKANLMYQFSAKTTPPEM